MNRFDKIANDILFELKRKFYEKDKVATGKTVNSLEYKTSSNNITILGASYIEFVEYGRGANKGGNSNGAFLDALKDWAKARNIPEPAVQYIYWKIVREGTLLYRKNQTAGIFEEVFNENLFKKIENEISFAYISDFKSQIIRNFPKK
jgi:hypothetical protein